MYPHIRHDNGKKLDIAFIRKKPNDRYAYNYFSLFGYGYSVEPLEGEINKPMNCASEGYWQYNIIEKYVPDQKWRKHTFPIEENRDLIRIVAQHSATKYVIIEPHIKERTGLSSIENIGSLGCWAIRHDDHMHVQAASN